MPSAPLHIYTTESGGTPATSGIYVINNSTSSSSANAVICARAGGSGGGSSMLSLDSYNVQGWSISNNVNNFNYLTIMPTYDGSGSTYCITCKPSGVVGINTSSPVEVLHVNGSVYGVTGLYAGNGTQIPAIECGYMGSNY